MISTTLSFIQVIIIHVIKVWYVNNNVWDYSWKRRLYIGIACIGRYWYIVCIPIIWHQLEDDSWDVQAGVPVQSRPPLVDSDGQLVVTWSRRVIWHQRPLVGNPGEGREILLKIWELFHHNLTLWEIMRNYVSKNIHSQNYICVILVFKRPFGIICNEQGSFYGPRFLALSVGLWAYNIKGQHWLKIKSNQNQVNIWVQNLSSLKWYILDAVLISDCSLVQLQRNGKDNLCFHDHG